MSQQNVEFARRAMDAGLIPTICPGCLDTSQNGRGTHFRVRKDRADAEGKVSLRYESRLCKIGIGRAHKGRAVKLLIADQSVRVIDLNGELIRELTLDPGRTYQPLARA